ncbi:uncharacterized protein KY384_002489 [Bacidia gigantensis]|uniref:uncharacterized protein n=1 Tax=Bacidia gigantensis TaxID=2732470 RepID=UPI001D037DF8|nr:uncharacterized protein KY384_002489 [Bacidia gigantensis]KAG8532612.1 hypothetical protein KY384_002489 [Bacidia gigantensis]
MEQTVGILGGGQLGRMLTESANRLNIRTLSLDAPEAPAKQINATGEHIDGSFKDPDAVRRLAKLCDILTVEIEHVNTDILEQLDGKVQIHPSWKTIRVIQDKFSQKTHLHANDIPTTFSSSLQCNTTAELKSVAGEVGYPFMLKSRTEAYDGRGNHKVNSDSDLQNALDCLRDRPLYAEKWADFDMELAVMVVKVESDPSSDWSRITKAFPVVETIHEDSICKLVYAPARRISRETRQKAQEMARKAVASFWGKGVFGCEMFLLNDGSLLVNEIAPRPHNSGHYTIDACPLSQYDAHLKAILGLPIPLNSLHLIEPGVNAIMLNILGGVKTDSHMHAAHAAHAIDGARIHLYGKGKARPGRKMGHITVLAGDMTTAELRMQPLIEDIDRIRRESQVNDQMLDEPRTRQPLVSITMGSDSDRSILAPGVQILKELDIPFMVTITSAHRTPDRMVDFAKGARRRGYKVIIAAAGGAAHLPGMIAAITPLPVIGLPVKASCLDGVDSLYSIAQMPVSLD